MDNAVHTLNEALRISGGDLQAVFGMALRSAAITLIIAILTGTAQTLSEKGNDHTIDLAGVLAISLLALGDSRAYFGLGRETLTALNSFSKVLLPALAGAAAASGVPAAAAASYAVTAMFMDILISLSTGVLQPLVYAYLAAEISAAATDSDAMGAVAGFLKWACSTALTVIVLAFVLYLSVTGIVGSAVDVGAIRVTKTVVSTTLPVVGSILTDAAGSVLAGAMTLKNSIGITGMASVLTLCMLPFLHLGAQYLLYKATSKLSAGVAGGRISRLVNGIAGAFGLMLATVGACGLMRFFSLISMLSMRA
ncbi:MAG: stage III sporulation protein AE [Oscillospiraceae bacterium]|jgi:stage III sporulation protein AE|nr:stage III sporulation protein AE [Oscillospiraceae bacterium]